MRDELMFPKEPKAAVAIALVELDGLVTKFKGKSFAIRAVAYSIDTTFFLAANYGLSFIAGTAIGIAGLITGQEPVFADSTSTSCLNSFLTVVMTLFYFSLFEGLYGATPGKLFLGMRVVLDDGSPCTLRAGLMRGLWRYIDAIFFGLVAYGSMKPPLQKRIGDKKAHTLVVAKNDAGITSSHEWPGFFLALVLALSIQLVIIFLILVTSVTFV